ncbi:ferredoxin reductase [Galbitalea sp. SE-J8]|nr:ferredoxin reductase [Galbitalea sp. SE-J8]MDM4764278.1 ferredoxin reductase [Galbitalea sp. SE-J8]
MVADWQAGTVTDAARATPSGRVLTLDIPSWPGNDPGQHLDLRLTAEDGYQAVRSYSIASYGTGPRVELAVDEVPDGEVSPYLVEDVRPGDELEVRGPLGAFFVWTPAQSEPVQLIAGGSGIVPLMAMARAHHDSGSTAAFRMLYSVRSAPDAYYAAELADLVDEHFALHWAYTRQAPDGWAEPAGRISRALLERVTAPASAAPLVYICGPTGFVEAAARIMVGLGHDPARVRTERFGGA